MWLAIALLGCAPRQGVDGVAPDADDSGVARPLASREAPVQPPARTPYLVVTVPALVDAATAWATYRGAQGYDASVVLSSDLTDTPTDGTALSDAVAAAAETLEDSHPGTLVHVLLLGDVPVGNIDGIPTAPCTSYYGGCYTDNYYAGRKRSGAPRYAVGRVPARNADQALEYLEKVQTTEAFSDFGTYNRRFFFYAGESGFDAELASLVESLVLQGLTNLDPGFDIIGAYNDPYSSFYYTPFDEKIAELLNSGSVLAMYLGHGASNYNDGLDASVIADLDNPYRQPFIALFACYNGDFSDSTDSVAESVLWAAGGPTVVLAAADITHPYANGVFPYELQRTLLSGEYPTAGAAVVAMKTAVVENDDEVRAMLDAFAALEGVDASTAEALLEQHEDLYNLLGDPATPIRLPDERVTFEVSGSVSDGALTVTGTVPGIEDGTAWVTLEVPRDELLGELAPIDAAHPDEATVQANWATAVNTVIVGQDVTVTAGAFDVTLAYDPEGLPGSDFYVKAYAYGDGRDAFGAMSVQ